MHLAIILGFVVGVLSIWAGYNQIIWPVAIVYGVRLAATYMGLVVLARLLLLVLIEVAALRPRRLYAIAKLSVVEANRRMWAPWVVLTVFGVILAFTHWFLQPPEQRPAEMGRLYISTLMLLCSLLITVMVAVLSPISLPQDIQSQTIFTVVSKPVRRLELVWGRMLGFMAMVTVLIAIFGAISLLYLYRNVRGTIIETRRQADEVEGRDPLRAAQLREQAEQLRTRMSAREPIKGSLTFIDSRGNPQIKGIDVGQDLSEDIEPRSHIEGATPATAIWSYGVIPDPYEPGALIDRRIPVDKLLKPDTIEYLENQALLLEYGVDAANQALRQGERRRQVPGHGRVAQDHGPGRTVPGRVAKAPAPGGRVRDEGRRRREGRQARRGRRAPRQGRRPALAAAAARDDLHDLPDDQGPRRRAGLRRDRGDQPQPADRPGPLARRLPDPRVLHEQEARPGLVPRRLQRLRSRSRSAASARRSIWAWARATCSSSRTRATSA